MIPTISPLASHQQGTCLPPASPPPRPGTFTAQASESTCPQCPPGELGWGFPSAAEGGPVPQRSSKKLLQRYRSSCTAPVPSIYVRATLYLSASPRIQCRATRAPCKGGDQALAPSRGRNKAPGSPQGTSLRGADVQRRCGDEASGREGKGQRGPGSPKPTELRLEAAVTLGPSRVRTSRVLTRGHSCPAVPRGLIQSPSRPRAAPPPLRGDRRDQDTVPLPATARPAQRCFSLLFFALPCLAMPCPALLFPGSPVPAAPAGLPRPLHPAPHPPWTPAAARDVTAAGGSARAPPPRLRPRPLAAPRRRSALPGAAQRHRTAVGSAGRHSGPRWSQVPLVSQRLPQVAPSGAARTPAVVPQLTGRSRSPAHSACPSSSVIPDRHCTPGPHGPSSPVAAAPQTPRLPRAHRLSQFLGYPVSPAHTSRFSSPRPQFPEAHRLLSPAAT
ncbi:uncharacterized protein LOC132329613 [Haemorhous mexicanus]|uniref:uncharacterized protein LOC132329613 n=1 Tax=Haemorhous mexicanus TaxID=30427 RepID=UPI0028BF16EE|nr:uncharacterized protein LOC132329613 [Haemorhous mexicanus]